MSDYAGHDRRRPTDRDWTSLRAWAEAIRVVGIPGAIALFVVYLGATELPKLVRSIETLVTEVRTVQHMQTEIVVQIDRLIFTTQKACWNAAKGDIVAQRACYDESTR